MVNNEKLILKAIEAAKNSYSPYSKFKVGATLLTNDNEIFLGCNIENSSFSLTNCAERTAIFKAISEGKKDFKAIAIMGSATDTFNEYCTPCGACRQVLAEFCKPDFKIILGRMKEENKIEVKEYTLKELLPESFRL